MAGVTKTLTFAEGVSTSGPTTTFLQTTQFATYADDATFVSNKGSAAADGDAYYDTTLDVIKIYANGAWQSVYDDSDTNIALLAGTQTFSGSKTFSSAVTVSDSTSSTTKDTGSIVTEGGVGIEENLNVGGNATITGDLTVNGTTTNVNTTNLDVTDANITINNGGNQATADSADAGLTVEMSDATDALMHYDSTATSKWKCGESGSTKEVATISDTQTLTNKTLTSPAINGSNLNMGTASNTNRILLASDTTTNLDLLTDTAGLIAYDTSVNLVVFNNGSGWGQLATPDNVSMRYTTDAGQTINHNTNTIVKFEDIDYDGDSIYNTTTGVMTCNSAGKYQINSGVAYDASAFTQGQVVYIRIKKNGSTVAFSGEEISSTHTQQIYLFISDIIDLANTDTIEIETYHNRGSSCTLLTAAGSNFFSAMRLGS